MFEDRDQGSKRMEEEEEEECPVVERVVGAKGQKEVIIDGETLV